MAISVWVLSLQESSHLPPPLLSRARLDSIACETTPPCLRSFPPPPSLSSHSPSYLTFNQRAANRYKLNCHSNIAPRRQALKTSICPSSVVPGHQPTCLQHGVNYNRGSARGRGPTRRRPTPLETQENRQRQKHADHWQPFTRAQFPGGRFPAKFGW